MQQCGWMMRSKKVRHKSIPTVKPHFYETVETVNLIYTDRWSEVAWCWGSEDWPGRATRTIWGTNGNILYLDCGDDSMSMWMCQNTLKYRLKWAEFNVCELYLNKVDFLKSVLEIESNLCQSYLLFFYP